MSNLQHLHVTHTSTVVPISTMRESERSIARIVESTFAVAHVFRYISQCPEKLTFTTAKTITPGGETELIEQLRDIIAVAVVGLMNTMFGIQGRLSKVNSSFDTWDGQEEWFWQAPEGKVLEYDDPFEKRG